MTGPHRILKQPVSNQFAPTTDFVNLLHLVLDAAIRLSPPPPHNTELHPSPPITQPPTSDDNDTSDNASAGSETVYEPDNADITILTPHSINHGELIEYLQPLLPHGAPQFH